MKKKNKQWMQALALTLALSLSSLFANAQKVPSLQSYLAVQTAANQQTINSLMNDPQPTAGVSANGISVFGNGSASVLDFNINNFSNVNFSDARLANVQLIKIRLNSVNDFSNIIDMSAAAGLNQLTCIVLVSAVNATTAQLNGVLLNVPSTVATCYSISIPN